MISVVGEDYFDWHHTEADTLDKVEPENLQKATAMLAVLGYVLADMGVYQTRDFFVARDGHLLDNPRIGPDLKSAYWQPGNSLGCLSIACTRR